MFMVFAAALTVWAFVAGLYQSMMMLPLYIAAAFAFAASLSFARDCARLMSQAIREETDEWRRAVRPRL
jgi:hypothetical protein